MAQKNIIEENFIKTITEYLEIIPYLSNNNYNNQNYYNIKECETYLQSFYNNLISLYDKNYYYSPINDIINLKNINFFSENYEQNLYLNIRAENYENTFKYLLGYKPLNTKEENYYFFKKISPNNINESEKEYIFVNHCYYENLIIPDELKIIGKSKSMIKSILLNVPLFIKHYNNIFCYSSNYENIKKKIIDELKTLNCDKYLYMFENLPSVTPKLILQENKNEYFYILTAMFLDKEFNNLTLNIKTIGYMMYHIIKNKSLCSLNLSLPPITEINNINFLTEKNNNSINKSIIINKKKPSNIQEYFGKKYIPVTVSEKNMYKDIFTNGFENLLNGGYSNNSEENHKIILKIQSIENIKDDKIITSQTILPKLDSIKQYKIENIQELENLLFSHLVIDKNFYNSHEYKKDLNKIYELCNKKLNIIKYNLDDVFFNVFSLSYISDEKKFIQIYMYYFNIIKNMYLFMINNKNQTNNYNIDFIVNELGLMVLKTLDIIGKLSINDVLAFRYYMEYYYNVLNSINKKISYAGVLPYLTSLIEKYNENVIYKYVGGDESNTYKILDFKNLYEIDYFTYTYLFDAITNLTENNNYISEFYHENDNPKIEFWDGITYEEYNNKSNNEKLVQGVVSYTMFINETINGDKMSFKIDKNNKIKRVCFLPKLINDNITVNELLINLKQQLDTDITYEKNIETFLNHVNTILKNTDISGLIKQIHKINDPKEVLGLISYVKNNNKPDKSNNTFIELIVFITVFLNKLGFKLNKNISKTNLKLEIEPKLSKENILNYLNKEGKEKYNELYKNFISENDDLLDFLILNSVDDDKYNSGGSSENKSIIILSLNPKLDILENNISDKILNIYENPEEINVQEKDFIKDEGEIFKKEKENLSEEIGYLLNLDELTDKNLYRIIPNYIKTQYNIFKNNNFLDDFIKKDIEEEEGGSNEHPIDTFLEKVNNYTEEKCYINNTNVSQEKINETINLILNERFFKNLNHSLLYYDNMLFNNDKNVYKTALYNTIKNFEYFKNTYKINIGEELKETLLELLLKYTEIEQYIYQIFIVSEYIKKFIIYMYQKLGIDYTAYEFNYEKFLKFYNLLECKFKEKSINNKKIYDFMNKHNLQKLSLDKTKHNFEKIDKKKIKELFENNNPLIQINTDSLR